MDNIVTGINQVVASVSLLITSFLGHPQPAATNTPAPTATAEQSATGDTYNISKNITYQGYTVAMNAAVPKNGGDITGDVSGSCTGPITGHYDGQDNGKITGNAQVTCVLSVIHVPGTVSFTGTVNKTAKNAQLLLVFSAASITKSQNVVVNFK